MLFHLEQCNLFSTRLAISFLCKSSAWPFYLEMSYKYHGLAYLTPSVTCWIYRILIAFCEQTSDEKLPQNASDQVLTEIVLRRNGLHDQLSLDSSMLIDDLDSGCEAGAFKVLSEVDEEKEREDSSIQEQLDMELQDINKGLQPKEGDSCQLLLEVQQ